MTPVEFSLAEVTLPSNNRDITMKDNFIQRERANIIFQ